MKITKRGASYQAQFSNAGRRYRKQFRTSSEAEIWLAEAKARALRGEPIDVKAGGSGSDKKLSELLSDVYRVAWAKTRAGHTAVQNATACIKALGDVAVSQVSTAAIDAAVEMWTRERAAPGTINRRLSALSKMLRYAHETGHINNMPILHRQRETQGRIRYLSKREEEEAIAYFKMIGHEAIADLTIVAIDTGMRRGELLRLSDEDIDDNTIRVWQTKNGRPRSVPMTGRVCAIVKSRAGQPRVFHELNEDTVRRVWDRFRAHMGMYDDRGFVFHALRHTFVSRLVQRGVNLRIVAALAGHTTITTTMRYAHLAPENLVDAIKLLE